METRSLFRLRLSARAWNDYKLSRSVYAEDILHEMLIAAENETEARRIAYDHKCSCHDTHQYWKPTFELSRGITFFDIETQKKYIECNIIIMTESRVLITSEQHATG